MEKKKKWASGYLPDDLANRMDAFLAKRVAEKGVSGLHGLKTKILEAALREWLDRHENDPNII
jgi:hypothetical protein